jgi:threonine/homoserine/homoserine lactone efflux protein
MTGLIAFLAVALVVIMTPGQDTFLTVRNTLAGGSRAGMRTAAGVVAGQLLWTAAATAGLAALFATNPGIYAWLEVAGAVYLLFLGAQSLRRALGGGAIALQKAAAPPMGGYFRSGLLSNLGNPKMLLFFSSLLPQFVEPGHSAYGLLLGATFAGLTMAWLAAYAVIVAGLGRTFTHSSVPKLLEAVAGVALIALGVRVVFDAV